MKFGGEAETFWDSSVAAPTKLMANEKAEKQDLPLIKNLRISFIESLYTPLLAYSKALQEQLVDHNLRRLVVILKTFSKKYITSYYIHKMLTRH